MTYKDDYPDGITAVLSKNMKRSSHLDFKTLIKEREEKAKELSKSSVTSIESILARMEEEEKLKLHTSGTPKSS